MAVSCTLGYPRMGAHRELKKATEAYWTGTGTIDSLQHVARDIRLANWSTQAAAGIDQIPSGDFSHYDQMLDVCAMLGAVPDRFQWTGDQVDLDTYFSMARGMEKNSGGRTAAMEMTKWFDTNYHYIVPELESDMNLKLSSTKIVDEYLEAQKAGFKTRPTLVGPATFLLLSKSRNSARLPLAWLDEVTNIYCDVLQRLEEAGATWIQLDEPSLGTDLTPAAQRAYARAYQRLSEASSCKLMVAVYFSGLRDNLETAVALPIDALHVDLVREPSQLQPVLESLPATMILSAGVVDGRNVWRNDLASTLDTLEQAKNTLGSQRLWVSSSCSLLHTPIDLALETSLPPSIAPCLAFAKQKLAEIHILGRGVTEGRESIGGWITAASEALTTQHASAEAHDPVVRERVSQLTPQDSERQSPFAERKKIQKKHLALPDVPTTTIGSFPQTAEIRQQRSAFAAGSIDQGEYDRFIESEISRAVRMQSAIGLDVLVHGEPERNDMVQYFGEQLTGFAFTEHAWVQSYGTRCVRPPIIYGDVFRPAPMTVRWSKYAQTLADKPVKGMLTGPVTILQWSFVRTDIPRADVCRQIGLAIRDEVVDLEEADIRIIQIDEPALREGLPIRISDQPDYLAWSTECFRLASSGVLDHTQIHSHMCYSEFNEIIESISKMDADVISFEASRSDMELMEAFATFDYPNEAGPGVYDIHSPRIPSPEEMASRLERALKYIPKDRLWANPDCGLKTRQWPEVAAALKNMVTAANRVRAGLIEA
jgi:5-methyltetrahydropteroyltriglutamate--homocysteine methyltransferase